MYAHTDKLSVRLGEHDHTIAGETNAIDFEVEVILQHPDYDPFTKDIDIALLKLKTKIAFSPQVYPISLPKATGDNLIK